eukprot:Transcript_10851.p1 GENE.Transcript_10851~~Transcript_10851.p1  ORF type:complete len:528 (-),score=139.13 Transcript_10851:996-2549(-)
MSAIADCAVTRRTVSGLCTRNLPPAQRVAPRAEGWSSLYDLAAANQLWPRGELDRRAGHARDSLIFCGGTSDFFMDVVLAGGSADAKKAQSPDARNASSSADSDRPAVRAPPNDADAVEDSVTDAVVSSVATINAVLHRFNILTQEHARPPAWPRLVDAADNVVGSCILSDAVLSQLASAMPGRFVSTEWRQLFSTQTHGFSLASLYTRVAGSGASVVVLRTSRGHVLGALLSDGIRKPQPGQFFYGTGESFLFSVSVSRRDEPRQSGDATLPVPGEAVCGGEPGEALHDSIDVEGQLHLGGSWRGVPVTPTDSLDSEASSFRRLVDAVDGAVNVDGTVFVDSRAVFVEAEVVGGSDGGSEGGAADDAERERGEKTDVRVYHWTGENFLFAFSSPSSISIGGGNGAAGLYLEDSLLHGSTGPTETFANPVLCPPQDLAGEPDVETERFEIAHLEVWGVDPTALRHADAAASGDAADRLPGGPHLHPSIRRVTSSLSNMSHLLLDGFSVNMGQRAYHP